MSESNVPNKKYAIGRYNPDGTRKGIAKPKRKRVVIKKYMTRRRKNAKLAKEIKTVITVMLLGMIGSSLIAFAETTNSFDISIPEVWSAPEIIEVKEPERVEVADYTVDNWKSLGRMEISHYSELDSCHYPTFKNGFRQCYVASGKIAKVGMVATNLYPFGTRLRINGEIYIVEDRISTRYNNRVDIFVGYGEEAKKEATELGIKHLEVEILNK